MCAFVGVLKPTPATDIVNENDVKWRVTGLDVGDESFQADSFPHGNARPSGIHIGAYDFDIAQSGIFADDVLLIFDRKLLVIC